MSLLFQVVFASACRNTHHRIALDALRHLRGADSERWTDVFLHHYRQFLTGSKAPDNQFKDFQNHVLHVGENFWGGAPAAARRWYGTTVDALRRQVWPDAVYAAGVLSHYFSDPFMPLHTGQTEGEAAVHRALEWSVAKSYGELQQILDFDLGGYPRVEAPQGAGWLDQMVRQGAELAHPHYQAVIDHYDLAKGVKQPTAGMDQECKDRIAQCLGAAVVGYARVLERAIEEAGVQPPHVEITLQGFLATLEVPIRTVVNQLHDVHERLVVEAIYDEVQRSGKVLQNLPEDDRTVRQLHAEEVLNVPLRELDGRPAEPTGTKHGQGESERGQPNRLIASPVIDNRSGRRVGYQPARRRPTPVAERRPLLSERARSRSQESGARGQEPGVRSQESGVGSRGPTEEPVTRRFDAAAETPAATVPPPMAPAPVALERQPVAASVPAPTSRTAAPAEVAPAATTPAAAEQSQAEIPKPRSSIFSLFRNAIAPAPKPQPAAEDLPAPASHSIAQPRPKVESPTPLATRQSEIRNLKSEISSSLRFRLQPESPIVDAPSIGNKTAERLQRAGINTVADLLKAEPDPLAARVSFKHVTPNNIRTWQAEARLACRVPEIYGHDAQILVASGLTEPAAITALAPADLLKKIDPFVNSTDGQRVLRSSAPPDLAEVTNWIAWARQSRQLRAA